MISDFKNARIFLPNTVIFCGFITIHKTSVLFLNYVNHVIHTLKCGQCVDKSVYKSISSAFFHPQSVDKKWIKNGYPHENRNIMSCFCAEFHINFTCFALRGKRWKINCLITGKLK